MASMSAQRTPKNSCSNASSITIHSSRRSLNSAGKVASGAAQQTLEMDSAATADSPSSGNTPDKAGKAAASTKALQALETKTAITASLTSKGKMPASTGQHHSEQSLAVPTASTANTTDTIKMAASSSQPVSTEKQIDTAPEDSEITLYDEEQESILSERLSETATTLTLQDDDIFEDAEDEEILGSIDLQSSFDDCNAAIKKFFDNDHMGAMAIMKPWCNVSLYHSLGAAVFEFIPAMLTFDKPQIIRALAAIKNCIRLCNKHRRTFTLAQSIGFVVKKHNYADCTDIEAHSELCYAEALLLQAALTVVDGEDYSSYLRGTLKIKKCFSTYKVCWQIKERKKWDSEQSKIHFDSGVRLGTATFNLMVSLLPSRIISLLEFVGFSGSRTYALNELTKGASSPGMRAVMCSLTILVYHLIIVPFIGGEGNVEASELIFQDVLETYPKSVWFLTLQARSEFLKGRLQMSILAYNRALSCQGYFKQFRILCYWELMWVHGLNLEFEDSAMYAERLVEESAWSKATHLYIKAAMLMQVKPRDVEHLKNIDNAMRLAPLATVRIAGKSIPMEKFLVKRCERYHRQKQRLMLPGLELLAIWNMFQVLKNNKEHLTLILKIIEKTREGLEKAANDWMGDFVNDNYALLFYLHGCILSALELPRQALEQLERVVDLKKLIKEDTFLVPYAVLEMASCYYQMGDMQTTLSLLNSAKKKYSGYNLETRLHFRVHAKEEVVRSVIETSKSTPGRSGIKV